MILYLASTYYNLVQYYFYHLIIYICNNFVIIVRLTIFGSADI